MNTQVLALLICGVSVMGALGIAALTVMIMAVFAWKGIGKQQQGFTGGVRVDGGHIKIGPFVFARVPLVGAGQWVRGMSKYDTLWQQVNGDCCYFLLVEKQRAPALAMA